MKGMLIPSWGVCLAPLPKCGSSSVRLALADHFGCTARLDTKAVQEVKPDLIPTGYKTMTTVRHPLDRFESLWRQKCRDGGKVAQHDGNIHGLSPEELFDYVRQHDNWHWTPQAELVSKLRHTQLDVIPLDYLGVAWHRYVPLDVAPLELHNSTSGLTPMTPELQQAVTDHYAADVDIYEKALRAWEERDGS